MRIGSVAVCLLLLSTLGLAAPPVRVIVTYKQAPGQVQSTALQNMGGKVRHTYWIVPAVAVELSPAALQKLTKDPNVAAIEPDVEVTALETGDEVAADAVDALDVEYDASWGVSRIGSDMVAAEGYTGAGVKVAVIDTGIDYNHPDLRANYVGGWDFVNNDNDPMDDAGHGTHCAGIIGAAYDGAGVVGVAPQCKLYALKVLGSTGSGSFSDIAAAMQWCVQNGIQVTSNSYGSTSNPGTTGQQIFDQAAAAGVSIIAAAGNSGPGTDTISYPAHWASVVAVGATDSSDRTASFSSTGPDLELSAPGVSVNSTLPNGSYGRLSGTSMACPHVAGAAAVLFGAGLTNGEDARYYLELSALDLGVAGRDSVTGFGLVELPPAIDAIGGTPPPPPPPPPPPTVPTTVSVANVGYALSGSRNKNLTVSVVLRNNNGDFVSGATVALIVSRNGTTALKSSGRTGTGGAAVFTISNARSGTYSTRVTRITAAGLTWDGSTPTNSFKK